MKKDEFRQLVQKKRLILDGATGSYLVKSGMPAGVCPEQWILEHKEVMINLQLSYLLSGTNVIYAPTFTSNSVKLSEYGLKDQVMQMNQALVSLSKEAVRRFYQTSENKEHCCLIAGDITMTGKQLSPMGTMQVEELIDIYKEQIEALVKADVDLLVVETMMSLQECRCALIAAKEVCDLPVMITMSFEEDGRSLYGTDPVTALVTLQSLGADAFGVNCSTGPDKMSEIIHILSDYSEIPLICKPNAGLPSLLEDGSTGYSMDADTFAEEMIAPATYGASILGGCCGTAPEYISKLCKQLENIPYQFQNASHKRILTSERMYCEFGLESNFMIVGERINPTGKKKLQAELMAGSFEMVSDFAEEQEENGARILDINMGMGGIDEKETMLSAIEEVTQRSNLPLCIDSSDPEVMEAALRHYPGRALMNSVSLETVKIEKMLPLAKRYGAMMILLPLSDTGLPKDIQEKKQIIQIVLQKAYEIGLKQEDIVVDGLVATVGANPNAAMETLETIRYCKDELQLSTICGLSNISFGLPERGFINAAFLTMAIAQGLTMAIANPNQDLLTNTAFASDLLKNRDGADIAYIEHIHKHPVTMIEKKEAVVEGPEKGTIEESGDPSLDELKKAILKGMQSKVLSLTKAALDAGNQAQDILNQTLLPAINEVGDLFDQGIYFLPQLIKSAETMKVSIEYLEPLLKSNGSQKEQAIVVVATVQGDIHDIGKNLVTLMLKNHGFRVIDLGKDVKNEIIIETALKEHADIIALSALMTTTMKEMVEVIRLAKEANCHARIMIGGAVITEEYAREIGADGYSKDAADAVKLAKTLIKKEGV